MFNVNDWSDKFLKLATEPMSKQLSEVFLKMLMAEGQNVDIPEIKGQFLYQVIDKRAEHMGLELSNQAKIFLMFLSKSPGNAVMYLSAIGTKTTVIDMDVIVNLFPIGFVPEKQLEIMWDAQKAHVNEQSGDNCLDQITFQKSVKSTKLKN